MTKVRVILASLFLAVSTLLSAQCSDPNRLYFGPSTNFVANAGTEVSTTSVKNGKNVDGIFQFQAAKLGTAKQYSSWAATKAADGAGWSYTMTPGCTTPAGVWSLSIDVSQTNGSEQQSGGGNVFVKSGSTTTFLCQFSALNVPTVGQSPITALANASCPAVTWQDGSVLYVEVEFNAGPFNTNTKQTQTLMYSLGVNDFISFPAE